MSKALLLSIVVALITVPTRMARHPNPWLGLRGVLKRLVLFNVFYWFALQFVWGRV